MLQFPMPTILIALSSFLTDPPIDLTTLPPDEAADRIRHSFGWLSSLIDVTVEYNTATIHLAATDARRADQALATIDRAGALAERGKYNQAIPLYQEALITCAILHGGHGAV
ncbi:MAG: hypothetical protein IPK16_20500 [Anaerolineales bacterium]|nr:hypothetical protein [Anaerolineales bacterium]